MFIPASVIEKKRNGLELPDEEIKLFMDGLLEGTVTDYQMTAFLMAVYFQGMSPNETTALTRAMLESGESYDWSHIDGPKVDKHSTGGVGDKVSIVIAPLAAACGLRVPMMAGRGLGHSGGTLDKMEAIPGFAVRASKAQFEAALRDVGVGIIGQSEKIAPADRRLYSLRDVTATVDCLPLIVASILSKKAAEGSEGLVFDVKVGNGAFMSKVGEARALAKALIRVGRILGLRCRAVITDMNQPLGYTVGNSLEVIESVEILTGKKSNLSQLGYADTKEVTLQLCAQMLVVGGLVRSLPAGRKLARQRLDDGSAWRKFLEMVAAQGGDVKAVQENRLDIAPHQFEWTASKSGYINQFDTKCVGMMLIMLGGGRLKSSDAIDHGVGLVFHNKIGAKVSEGDSIATVYYRNESRLDEVKKDLSRAIVIKPTRRIAPTLIVDSYED